MKLNLGSGQHAVDGWVNIDRSPNVILDRFPALKGGLRSVGLLKQAHMAAWDRGVERGDIRALRFPNGVVDVVYSSHTFEHLYVEEAERVTQECFRVLRPGGTVRLALPDVTVFVREFLRRVEQGDLEAGQWLNDRLLAHPRSRPGLTDRLRGAVGGHVHYWQPSVGQVRLMLERAGFRKVEELEFRRSAIDDIDRIETRPESFFLEARKP